MNTEKNKKVEKGNYRRNGEDRRGWAPMPEPPFKDSDGETVTRDRRRTYDRRKSDESPV